MDASEFQRRLSALVASQRARCLGYLRDDLSLDVPEHQQTVLEAIQRHGGLAAFREAGELKQWLFGTFSATS